MYTKILDEVKCCGKNGMMGMGLFYNCMVRQVLNWAKVFRREWQPHTDTYPRKGHFKQRKPLRQKPWWRIIPRAGVEKQGVNGKEKRCSWGQMKYLIRSC